MKIDIVLKEIYKNFSLASARDRRELLINKMEQLSRQGKNCSQCQGFCCTSVHNSMQITPLEALELCESLQDQERLDERMLKVLEENIQQFRLDKDLVIGKGKIFRRTYTCPFFSPGPQGCTISLHQKPYGCLGFNPLKVNVSEEGHCGVYGEVHDERKVIFAHKESLANTYLKEQFKLYWDKLPIPLAITELTKAIGK